MSLWTPSGEHRVDPAAKDAPTPSSSTPSSTSSTPPSTPPPGAPGEPSLEDLTPEQRAQVEETNRQMDEARARMLQMPSGAVVGQQAMPFYELAAIYLSENPPRLDDARNAIDALAGVVDKLGSRLGEAEQPLRQALHQLQMAFVEASKQAAGSETPDAG